MSGLPVREQDAADVASVQQLAVLLQAGITPDRAWEYLASAGNVPATEVMSHRARGCSLAQAIGEVPGWSHVSTAWSVATVVGAPLATSLRTIAAALADAGDARDDVRVALAEPASTARLVGLLPLVAVALGGAFGFDVVRTLTNPVGVACVCAGAALMVIARIWTRRMVAAAQPLPDIPGLHAELLAVALSGGVSITRAETVVAGAGGGHTDAPTAALLALSRAAGAPAVELLRAAAAHERQRARTSGRLDAAKLSSRLLLPLGVCTLPSFLLLGVAPMLLGVMSGTSLGL